MRPVTVDARCKLQCSLPCLLHHSGILLVYVVNNLGDDEISIYLKDNTSPIIAQEKSHSNLVYVLMPMRV